MSSLYLLFSIKGKAVYVSSITIMATQMRLFFLYFSIGQAELEQWTKNNRLSTIFLVNKLCLAWAS